MSDLDKDVYLPRLLVPTSEVGLVEVSTEPFLKDTLARVMGNELPGFVVRRAGLEDSPAPPLTQLDLSEVVIGALYSLGYIFKADSPDRNFSIKPDEGTGYLHTDFGHYPYLDASNGHDDEFRAIQLHTTVSGAGKVTFGLPGENIRRVYIAYRGEEIGVEDRLGAYLLSGSTDPDLMEPVLHTAQVETGDHVVFAHANHNGRIWHRFDTSSAPRKADTLYMRRDFRAEARQRRNAAKAQGDA